MSTVADRMESERLLEEYADLATSLRGESWGDHAALERAHRELIDLIAEGLASRTAA